MKAPTIIAAGLAVHARTIATARRRLIRSGCLWTTFVTIALGLRPAQAAVTEAWVHRNNHVVSSASNQAIQVVHDAAGDIIVTGHSGWGLLIIKYSGAAGSVLWRQRGRGRANALTLDSSGNVVVTGGDYYTPKYAAADGTLLWETRYNGPANGSIANAVAVDGSGNVVVTGYSHRDINYADYYTAKYAAADGALIWERRYRRTRTHARANAVAVDASGNVVVTGTSEGDYYTAKYAAADGALLWEKRYNGPATNYDLATALALDASGNVVVTGASDLSFHPYEGYSGGDYYTAKYAAADGALLWEKRYNGPANDNDQANAVAVDANGNVVVTGASYGASFTADYYTAKHAAVDGALLWEQRYDGSAPYSASAEAVAVDASGNVVVTKRFDALSDPSGNQIAISDFYTAKYAAASGALLWEKRYNGPAKGHDQAVAVALDGSGNVVVTGSSDDAFTVGENGITDGEADYYTAKYAAADGALLWERLYNGPANGDDLAWALALDSTDNVVVTGHCFNGTNSDYSTVKYAAADGALLWEKRYNGPAKGHEWAYAAVAVDGSGNVVVRGSSDGRFDSDGNSIRDHYTAKYAAANGALVWEKRDQDLEKTAHQYQWPRAAFAGTLAVDASGNVLVTGYSGSDPSYDYYTAKYAAADGALLWEKRYDGNGDDLALALAADASDNVVVTGISGLRGLPFGGYSGGVYYTAKYAAADGALLWEKRYNDPENGNDRADAVAVDGSGNVVVTGYSGYSDYYTAKYAAADGALIWEIRYTGRFLENYPSGSLALGPNGMIAVITGFSSGDNEGATVVYRETAEAVSIALLSTGVHVRFTGVPGRSYNIERAPAVTGPWSTLNTQSASASGPFEHLDTNSPAAAAFYRTSEP